MSRAVAEWLSDKNTTRLMVSGRNLGHVQKVERRFGGYDYHAFASGMTLGIYITPEEGQRTIIDRVVSDGHLTRPQANALLKGQSVVDQVEPAPATANLAGNEFKPLSQRLLEKQEADLAAAQKPAEGGRGGAGETTAEAGQNALDLLKARMASMPKVEPILTNAEHDAIDAALSVPANIGTPERRAKVASILNTAVNTKTTEKVYGQRPLTTEEMDHVAETTIAYAEQYRRPREVNVSELGKVRKLTPEEFAQASPGLLGTAQYRAESSEPQEPQEPLTMEERVYTRRLLDCIWDQRDFSQKTFGPGQRLEGVIEHIRRELIEIELVGGRDVYEWIDVAFLALDGAWRNGYTPEEITRAWIEKFDKNVARDWPDWRTMPEGVPIEHIRTEDELAEQDAIASQVINEVIAEDYRRGMVVRKGKVDPALAQFVPQPGGISFEEQAGKYIPHPNDILGFDLPPGHVLRSEASGIYQVDEKGEVIHSWPAQGEVAG